MLSNLFKHASVSNSIRPGASARSSDPSALKQGLTEAVQQGRHSEALGFIRRLEGMEPSDPRWPHKCGDVFRAAGKRGDAAAAYRRAAKLYNERGFPARAQAMSSLARQLAPQRIDSQTFEHDMVRV